MSTYRVTKSPKESYSPFAIGRDTNTLFLILPTRREGVVIIGKGVFTGCEGAIVDPFAGKGIDYFPRGATIEIKV